MIESKTSNKLLNVFLKDTLIGSIARLADDSNMFVLDREYVENPDRPIVSLSFKSADGGVITDFKRTRARLTPFFSNLLPEGHLREYLANKLKINKNREFFLIAALGGDLPGAIRIVGSENLTDAYRSNEPEPADDIDQILRFSLAGVQLKFSAIQESREGFTIPVHGSGGFWIIKLPSDTHERVPEAEFSMLKLAQKAGIDVPDFKLVPTSSIAGLPEEFHSKLGDSLAIRRFDRADDGQRIHMEDFAQVFGRYPSDKYGKASYDNIATVLWAEDGETSLRKFIERLVFTIAIGNGDMHLKNWTLLYTDPQKPTLSPAYDFVPTILYIPGDRLGLNLGGTKDFDGISMDHFKILASRARAPERLVVRTVTSSIERIRDAWRIVQSELPLPGKMLKTIEHHMQSLPLLS